MSTWLAFSLAADLLVSSTQTAPSTISFDEAIGLAHASPEVRGAKQADSDKRDLLGAIPSMTHNPQFYFQPGYRMFARENQGIELQGNVMQSWSLAGLSSARRKAASAEADELTAEARALALSTKLGIARSWIDLWAAEKMLAVAQDEAALATDLAKMVDKALAASAATKADSADARAYQAEARLAVIGAEGVVTERALDLGRETARGAGLLHTIGDLPVPTVPDAGALTALQKRVVKLPIVEQKALAARAERAREVEEKAARGSVLSLGIALQRDQPGGFVAFGAVGLTMPMFDQGQRERSVTVARAARLEGERDKAALDASVELALAVHEVEHTGELMRALQTELVPALEAGLSSRLRIYEAGEATILEVLTARRGRVAAKSRLERARADHAWASVKVWLLCAAIEEGNTKEEGSR